MFSDKLKNMFNIKVEEKENRNEKNEEDNDEDNENNKGTNMNKNNYENKIKTDKRKIENLFVFIIILIITIICINSIINDKKENKEKENIKSVRLVKNNNTDIENKINQIEAEEDNKLEEKLKNILSKIEGVGEVEVCINYSESSEIVAMYNENSKMNKTEETDNSGGVRKIETQDIQKDIVYKEENGEKVPLTKKMINPKIEGAIITAKGAKDLNIKANIIQATEALTGLATHKIQVFQMN